MRVHHIAFRTRDVAVLASFYRDQLGLSPIRVQGVYSIWFAIGDAILMIEQAAAQEPPIDRGSMELIAFRTSETEQHALRLKLEAHGVGIESATDFTFYVRDPDGRRIGFSRY